jgi:hypothetical protein
MAVNTVCANIVTCDVSAECSSSGIINATILQLVDGIIESTAHIVKNKRKQLLIAARPCNGRPRVAVESGLRRGVPNLACRMERVRRRWLCTNVQRGQLPRRTCDLHISCVNISFGSNQGSNDERIPRDMQRGVVGGVSVEHNEAENMLRE